MVRTLLAILACTLSMGAQAQTHRVGGGCEALQLYKPSDDVEVKDGVNAEGWAVAPADIAPPAIGKESFDQLGIALDVPLSDYVDQNDYNFNASETDIWLGRVNVDKDGQVDFNRQPIGNEAYFDPDCIPEKKQ